MSKPDYAYAVARIRANEAKMLKKTDFDQLIQSNSLESCFDMLRSKGISDENKTYSDINKLIADQGRQLWALMCECVEDKSLLDVFVVQNDFYNIKAAIKCYFSSQDASKYFKYPTSLDVETLPNIIANARFEELGENFAQGAKEAFEVANQTQNGQNADIILDKSAMQTMLKLAQNRDDITKEAMNFLVACANIKIAVRSARTGKNANFIKKSLCACDNIDINKLADSSSQSEQAVFEYLQSTDFSNGAEILQNNGAEFEKWCDDKIIEIICKAKYIFFGFEPICAYYFAKKNEIQMLRLILFAKSSGLDESIIKERMRQLYV